MKIVSLATSYNRREKTLKALDSLCSQILPDNVSIAHYLVDDGCTDGTPEVVRKYFPEINIVSSPGNLFWAGGMRFGWSQAVSYIEFDYIFVYNDDVVFYENALTTLLDAARQLRCSGRSPEHVIAGSFLDSNGQSLTYGGVIRSSYWHSLRFSLVEPDSNCFKVVDTVNMNGCLISREAIDHVGFLSDYFVHGGADYDFGLKLRSGGGLAVISPGHIGVCDCNPIININKLSWRQRLRYLLGPKGQPIRQRLIYYSKYGGLCWPIWFILPYLRLLRF